MGRNCSRKSASDVETASESLIHPEMGSSTFMKSKETSPRMPVSASLQSSQALDDIQDKRNR